MRSNIRLNDRGRFRFYVISRMLEGKLASQQATRRLQWSSPQVIRLKKTAK
ncbi:MAG: hypothetical protein J7M18_08860 [Candidatus Eremiobacteraeota bacterium]|nr:hypothetical protein [Candidatus Eremiobacteraeota bacterium]